MIQDTKVDLIPGLVAHARATYNSGRTKPLAWRFSQLDALERLVNENQAELATALKSDLGVNDFWCDGVELEVVRQELKLFKANLKSWAAPKNVSTPLLNFPAVSQIYPEPYGVVCIISPWNYPISLVLVPLLSALAAGNTVVVKPSELSVQSSSTLARLCRQYLDNDAVTWVQGGVPPTVALLKERFDFICYTGNGTVARIVHAAATKHLTPMLLELGGKCPAIISPKADLQKSIRRIVWGKFSLNMGQTCISPDYIAVTPETKDAAIKLLIKTVAEFYPKARDCQDVSRIINARHTERLAKLLDDPSIEILAGGEHDVAQRYLAPTVVRATTASKCMKDEIFGPVLPVVEFSSVGVKFAN